MPKILPSMQQVFLQAINDDNRVDAAEVDSLTEEAKQENAASGGCCSRGNAGTRGLRELVKLYPDSFTADAHEKVQNWLNPPRTIHNPGFVPLNPGFVSLNPGYMSRRFGPLGGFGHLDGDHSTPRRINGGGERSSHGNGNRVATLSPEVAPVHVSGGRPGTEMPARIESGSNHGVGRNEITPRRGSHG